VMTTGPRVTLRDLPPTLKGGDASALKFAPPKELALDVRANEELLVLQALDDTGGNISKAAAKLGVSRRTLHRKLSQMRAAEKARSEAIKTPEARPASAEAAASNPTT